MRPRPDFSLKSVSVPLGAVCNRVGGDWDDYADSTENGRFLSSKGAASGTIDGAENYDLLQIASADFRHPSRPQMPLTTFLTMIVLYRAWPQNRASGAYLNCLRSNRCLSSFLMIRVTRTRRLPCLA
jgi:hypothetical protein